MSLVALHISPSGREESESKEKKASVINARHPVNPALKEEGAARTAHWLEGGLGMPASPAWPVPAQRIRKGRKEPVEGEQWRAANGLLPTKDKGRSRDWGGCEGPREEPEQRPRRRLRPAQPPQQVPMGQVRGHICSPH